MTISKRTGPRARQRHERLCGLDEVITGFTPAMVTLKRQLLKYARTDHPVLITGETGVGKDRFARAIHDASPRYSGPFCAVNCGALPKELVEAELFGTVSGAFTGATQRSGWFQRASGGTLFLDEIGDMPLPAQTSLLRALEDGRIWAVGGQRPSHVDCRIVAATHQNIDGATTHGQCRQDLYHRLSVLNLHIPPLRERLNDIPYLVEQIVPHDWGPLTAECQATLMSYGWPGNIRELRNILMRSYVEASGEVVTVEHLKIPPPSPEQHSEGLSRLRQTAQPLEKVVSAYIAEVLTAQNGNVRATARILGISPTTVYKHLRMSTPCDTTTPAPRAHRRRSSAASHYLS